MDLNGWIFVAFIFAFYAVGVILDICGHPKLCKICFAFGLLANLLGIYYVY